MKSHLITSTTSFRRFTRVLAALLLTIAPTLALLLLAPPDAQAQRRPRRQLSRALQSAKTQRFREHIPPLTLTDGSLEIETLEFSSEEHGQPGNRPHRYKKTNFNHIYGVKLWNITEEDVIDDETPELGPGWRVHIWLEERQSDGTYRRLTSTSPDAAQIVVKGSSFEIETDKELRNPQPTGNSVRPSRYDYPPYSAAHFRIAEVAACRGNCNGKGNKITLGLEPDRTKVHVKIFFRHPH